MGKLFKEWTNEEKERMIELHNDNLTNQEIADIFDTSKTMISRILRSLNVPSRHPALTPERKQQIKECYEEHRNLMKVSKIMHCNTGTVAEILKEYGIEQLSASELRRKYDVSEDYFDVIDNQNKAYSLGMIFSDGTVSKKGNHIAIALQECDRYLLERLSNEFGGSRPLSFLDYKHKNPNWQDQYCLTVTNKKMHSDLVRHGAVPNKSLILKFPTTIPDEFIPHFVRGYFDGDGTISKNECRCSLISTDDFCRALADLVKKELDIHCSIMYLHGNREKSSRVLSIAGRRQVKKFLDWIYNDAEIYLKRKHEIYLNNYYPDTNNSLSE